MSKELDVNLALAGVCQAATLVQQVARNGIVESDAFSATLESIVRNDVESAEQVFGGLENVILGFKVLRDQLSNKPLAKDAEITRYIAGVLALERKLSGNRKAMASLGERIDQLQRQQQHFELTSDQMLANMASVYSDVISPIGPRIQVAGNPEQLKQPLVQNKIRALLLAAIRAAVLWRQLGGKRRNILLSRRKILTNVEATLQRITTL